MVVEHFITFFNQFNIFSNTGAPMLDCIYPMPLKLLHIFRVKKLRFCHYVCNIVMGIFT